MAMEFHLTKKNANLIVRMIEDITRAKVVITMEGRVIAASDPSSIGEYNNRMVEVEAANTPITLEDGIAFPIFKDTIHAGAIKLIGDPEEMQHYTYSTSKLAQIVLEQASNSQMQRNERSIMNYVLSTLIRAETNNREFVANFLAQRHVKSYKNYVFIIVEFQSRMNPANLAMMDQEVYRVFDQTESDLYTFFYPNEYVLLIDEETLQKTSYLFVDLAARNGGVLNVGIGHPYPMRQISLSYEAARTALISLHNTKDHIAFFDRLGIELIFADASLQVRKQFAERAIGALNDKEKAILTTYYENDMALKETAESLFIHRNTLQYQLDSIHKKTGFNPRTFRDAVSLYLALRIE